MRAVGSVLQRGVDAMVWKMKVVTKKAVHIENHGV